MIQFISILVVCFISQLSRAQTWEWVNPLPQGNSLFDVQTFNVNTAVAVGDAATFMKTMDGGATWDIQHLIEGIDTRLNSVHFVNESVGYIVGLNGLILKTMDGGVTWESQSSGTIKQLWGVFFSDANNRN